MGIRVKRAYVKPAKSDGFRVLVDRIWPRGISKKEAYIDEWMKEAAPSSELRKWFGHDPEKWKEFKKRYFQELDNGSAPLKQLREKAKTGRVTLVYAARDEDHNNAVALKEYLEKSNED